MAETPSRAPEVDGTPGLKRSLSIWAPGTARKLGIALAAREGIKAPDGTAEVPATGLATAGDEAS